MASLQDLKDTKARAGAKSKNNHDGKVDVTGEGLLDETLGSTINNNSMIDMKDLKADKDKGKDWKQLKELKLEKDSKFFKDKTKESKLTKTAKVDKVIKPVIKKRRKRTQRETWKSYIHKVLKTVHEDDCTLSSKAMGILDSFAHDFFERISSEAVKLLRLNNKKTLTSLEVQTAARLVLPGELCKHAIHDGAKAVSKYQLTDSSH